MAHGFLASLRLENLDGGVIACLECVDDIVGWPNRRALVDKIELDSIFIQDEGVETEEIKIHVTRGSSIITGWLDRPKIEETIRSRIVNV